MIISFPDHFCSPLSFALSGCMCYSWSSSSCQLMMMSFICSCRNKNSPQPYTSVHVLNHCYVKILESVFSFHNIECSTTLSYPCPDSCLGILSSRKRSLPTFNSVEKIDEPLAPGRACLGSRLQQSRSVWPGLLVCPSSSWWHDSKFKSQSRFTVTVAEVGLRA